MMSQSLNAEIMALTALFLQFGLPSYTWRPEQDYFFPLSCVKYKNSLKSYHVLDVATAIINRMNVSWSSTSFFVTWGGVHSQDGENRPVERKRHNFQKSHLISVNMKNATIFGKGEGNDSVGGWCVLHHQMIKDRCSKYNVFFFIFLLFYLLFHSIFSPELN